MKFKKHMPYDILIRPTPNDGFIVEVGCVKIVYAHYRDLLEGLTVYLQDPEAVEKQYNDDIAKPDRVHIRHIPDIQATGRNYSPGNIIHPHKENEL